MKAAFGGFLLILSSCAAPRAEEISIAAPESRHQRLLDRLAGELGEPETGDPEAEFSFQLSLLRSKVPRFVGGGVDVHFLGNVYPELPRPADYGLYANLIP